MHFPANPKTSGDDVKTDQEPKVFMKADDSKSETDYTKPTNANTVDEIKAYLDNHDIDYKGVVKKDELLKLVGD